MLEWSNVMHQYVKMGIELLEYFEIIFVIRSQLYEDIMRQISANTSVSGAVYSDLKTHLRE